MKYPIAPAAMTTMTAIAIIDVAIPFLIDNNLEVPLIIFIKSQKLLFQTRRNLFMVKKILVPGLAAGIVMLITFFAVGWVFNLIFPGLQNEYYTPVFRPMSDPLMMYMYIHPFVTGIMMALVYSNVKKLVKGKDWMQKGMKFGFYWWIIVGIPGMLMSLSSFQISTAMVLSWTVTGLFQLMFGGKILAKMIK
jgi:hypothetical protein